MATALIITTAGINCELELATAFELAGAQAELVHLNRLMADPARIDRYDLIGLPGGFSYGDAVAAGRIAAQLMRRRLYPALVGAIERGVPIIAPCNGFQIAVQIGLLPGAGAGSPLGARWPPERPPPSVTLAANASARFIDRWVALEVPPASRSIWTRGLGGAEDPLMLPIAHAEGRFVPRSDEELDGLEQNGQVALRYAAGENPNGSVRAVAGLCDPSGLVLGLMPHPERFTRWTQHPWWTRLPAEARRGDPPGLAMFRNAVRAVTAARTASGREAASGSP